MALKNAADERCWREICLVPISTGNGTPTLIHDLLIQPGKISLKDLTDYCSLIWAGTSSDELQKQIKLNMMGVCLLNSVLEPVSQRLDTDKEKWFFKARGGKDGLIIFKLLMQYSLQTTCYGSETTRDKLHSLHVKAFENNIEQMLLHRKTLLDDIQVQGQVFHDDLFRAFKCLETVQYPVTFIHYIEDKKTKWEEGSDLTAAALCKFAERSLDISLRLASGYLLPLLHLSIIRRKKTPNSLHLLLRSRNLQNLFPKSGDNHDNQKSKWKFEAPAPGASIEKEVNGKKFWWCTGLDGKHHKPMYCHHKPQDCKE